jgi:putative Holliday junction resolvase
VKLGRLLGLDPGQRRVGVAVSDAGRLIATPHSVIDKRRVDPLAVIDALCRELDIDTIVVGLPISLSGEEGAAAETARSFGDRVGEVTGRNLVYSDERFTSVQAEHVLLEAGMRRQKRRDTRDKVAAAFMLQGYLDAANTKES